MSDLRVFQIDERHREQWNGFVAQSPHFALMQSYEWGEFKERLGWQAIRVAIEHRGRIVAGAQMLIRSLPFRFASIAYVPRGPLVDWEDRMTTTALLDVLHREAKWRRAIFLKIEPAVLYSSHAHQTLQCYGFQASRQTNQPRATIIIDLNRSLDEILADMKQKTRYNIKYAERKEVTVYRGHFEDVKTFYHLLKTTSSRDGFPARSWDYYAQFWYTLAEQRSALLLLAAYQGQTLAGLFISMFGNRAAYLYGASSNEHRNLMPNYLLQWEAMKRSRDLGCISYDLWGIPDEVGQAIYEGKDLPTSDCTDGLWGVYRFKSGFSKNVVYYMGAYDYVYSPFLYMLITNKFFNADRLDRIAAWMDSLGRA